MNQTEVPHNEKNRSRNLASWWNYKLVIIEDERKKYSSYAQQKSPQGIIINSSVAGATVGLAIGVTLTTNILLTKNAPENLLTITQIVITILVSTTLPVILGGIFFLITFYISKKLHQRSIKVAEKEITVVKEVIKNLTNYIQEEKLEKHLISKHPWSYEQTLRYTKAFGSAHIEQLKKETHEPSLRQFPNWPKIPEDQENELNKTRANFTEYAQMIYFAHLDPNKNAKPTDH